VKCWHFSRLADLAVPPLSRPGINHVPQSIGRRRKPKRESSQSADVHRNGRPRGYVMRGFMKLLRCERGANAIEYALVATLISIAAIAAFNNLGNKIDAMYNNVGNAM
jgi:pilus assembly protein Flp/PilA